MVEKEKQLVDVISKRLQQLWPIVDFYNNNEGLYEYLTPVLEASQIVEQMILLLAYESGYEICGQRVFNKSTGEEVMERCSSPFAFAISGRIETIPDQIKRFLDEIRYIRNVAAHTPLDIEKEPSVQYGEAVVFADAFDCFVGWFVLNSKTLKKENEQSVIGFIENVRSLRHKLTIRETDLQNENREVTTYDLFTSSYGVNDSTSSLELLSKMDMLMDKMKEIENGVIRIERTVDDVAEKIDAIADRITDYQALITRQITMAKTDEEIDRIISAYTDECVSRLSHEINSAASEQAYNTEKEKLVLSIDHSAWNKLDSSSQDFLITAKLTYNSLLSMKDIVDYSGVCLLVTKAVEVEMSKRFCRDYVSFLKEKYPGKQQYEKFPSALLNKYNKPVKPKEFTLGSVAYVLCYKKSEELTEEQMEIDHKRLMEYVPEKLMKGKSTEEIEKAIAFIAESVEDIRQDYRNPSAHTNQLQRVNAKDCFDLVLDIEKVLKTMLDTLDY